MACTRFAVIVTLGLLSYACHADAAPAIDAGQKIYQSVCRACHGPENVMVSAPKAGDTAEWDKRLATAANGIETLTYHAVDGFAAMPAKCGASALTRQQIRQAIGYMAAPQP
jgi:cytochrome c5